jgi:hypothetical protein
MMAKRVLRRAGELRLRRSTLARGCHPGTKKYATTTAWRVSTPRTTQSSLR